MIQLPYVNVIIHRQPDTQKRRHQKGQEKTDGNKQRTRYTDNIVKKRSESAKSTSEREAEQQAGCHAGRTYTISRIANRNVGSHNDRL